MPPKARIRFSQVARQQAADEEVEAPEPEEVQEPPPRRGPGRPRKMTNDEEREAQRERLRVARATQKERKALIDGALEKLAHLDVASLTKREDRAPEEPQRAEPAPPPPPPRAVGALDTVDARTLSLFAAQESANLKAKHKKAKQRVKELESQVEDIYSHLREIDTPVEQKRSKTWGE